VHARAEQFQIAGGHRRGAYRDRSVTAKIEVETGAAGDRRKGSIGPLPFGQLRQRKADPITFSRNLLSSYSSPGSSKGSGRTSAALATVNIEATAAIPSVTVPTAIAVNAGVRPRARML
jgi:hypothetical protein